MKFKKLLLGLLLAPVFSWGQAGIVTNYVRLQPTTIPALCNTGDIRFDTATNLLATCGLSNVWTEYSLSSTIPMTTLGDTIYENATPAAARLAGNITTTKKYLSQTGTGSVSAAPAWSTITAIDTNAVSNSASYYPLMVSSSSTGNQVLDMGSGLTFNPSTNVLTTTTFAGALTGTASGNLQATANQYGVLLSGSGNTATVLAPDASTTKVLTSGGASANPTWASPAASGTSALTSVSNNATYYPVLVGANSSSSQALDVGPMAYNPSTGALTTTTFIGALTGTASTATNATNVATTTQSGNTTYYLPFVAANSSSNQAVNVGPATYNPSTGVMTATNFTGAVTGTASLSTAPAAGSAHGAVTLDGSAHFHSVAPGTSGNVLQSNGTDWASASIVTGNSVQVPYKNRVLNGNFLIDQKSLAASGITITAAAALNYVQDQWYAYSTGANVTYTQAAGAGSAPKVAQFTGAASVTGIGFCTRMEAKDTYDLNNQTVTISENISNSVLTTVNWNLYRATTTADTFGTLASPTVTSECSGSWTVTSSKANYTASCALDSSATTGLQLCMTVGAQTSGTWKTDSVQLELGSTATNFAPRPYAEELLMVRRFLPCWSVTATNDTFPLFVLGATSTAATGSWPFSTPTRVAVTGVTSSTAANIKANRPSTGSVALTSFSFGSGGVDAAAIQINTASGLVADQSYYLFSGSGAGYICLTGAQL